MLHARNAHDFIAAGGHAAAAIFGVDAVKKYCF